MSAPLASSPPLREGGRIAEGTFFLTAAELGPLIRRREISPVELTLGYLERIRLARRRFNTWAHVLEEEALAEARVAEAEIARGRYRGPLHGIPYGVKDLLAVKGAATTWGAAPCADQRFDFDATVVRRLREAGAILLGKLAMVEFAGCLGYRYPDSSLQGPGRNPWNSGRWTGGSSSGSGAAVAAGEVVFAIGTETWGSILCPAAFCGVTGLRPTYGRVSRFGGMVGSWTFDKIGPLTRSAADARLVLGAIAGRDPADPSAAREPVNLAPGHRPMRDLNVALVPLDFARTKGAEPVAARDQPGDDRRRRDEGVADAPRAAGADGRVLRALGRDRHAQLHVGGSAHRSRPLPDPAVPRPGRGDRQCLRPARDRPALRVRAREPARGIPDRGRPLGRRAAVRPRRGLPAPHRLPSPPADAGLEPADA